MERGTSAAGVASQPVPLCVDLDGTLVATDTLDESVVALAKSSTALLALLPIWLLRGRAALKRELAARVSLDSASLPYDENLLAFLRTQRAAGREVWLVTGAPRRTAEAIAAHLGLFDGVLATEGDVNLTAATKARVLTARFPAGFDYAGNSFADLAVWRVARRAVVVAASDSVMRRVSASVEVEAAFPRPRPGPGVLLRALRVHQWAKNGLVLVPVLTAHRVRDLGTLAHALLAFVAFSMVASAVYLLNDMLDVDSDRRHKRKRKRPIASGALSIRSALVLVPALLATGLAAASMLPAAFGALLIGYFLTTSAYSLGLKRRPVVDVLVLAGLYTMRILGGGLATGIAVSEWLAAFSMFLFLSLALLKRASELFDSNTPPSGRGYVLVDRESVLAMGTSAGYMAVLVLALYISSPAVRTLYARPQALWGVCPLLLFWISRIWLKARRGLVHDDPIVFALRDYVTFVLGVIGAAILVAAAG